MTDIITRIKELPDGEAILMVHPNGMNECFDIRTEDLKALVTDYERMREAIEKALWQ